MVKIIISVSISIIFMTCLQAKTIVFLHGGPGLNSEPERNILGPYLKNLGHESFFWNEPSELRPETFLHQHSFQQAVKSADKFINNICQDKESRGLSCGLTLVAHSFASHYAVRLAQSQKDVIKEIILISPALNIKDADTNILQLAVNGLKDEGQFEACDELAEIIPLLDEAFDAKKIQAFSIGSKYAGLFLNYWSNHELMQLYFSYMVGEFSFDVKGMFEVRASMPIVNLNPSSKIDIPTHVYFGEIDPVTKIKEQMPLLNKYFSNIDVYSFSGVRHYPHLEVMDKIHY